MTIREEFQAEYEVFEHADSYTLDCIVTLAEELIDKGYSRDKAIEFVGRCAVLGAHR